MVKALKRPCSGGCGRLVCGGYCEACTAKGKGKEQRPEYRHLYGRKWQRESKAWLGQGRNGIAVDIFNEHDGRVYAATEVDHIVAHKGDWRLFWDRSNWQGLTQRDHARKTALEQAGKWPPAGMQELPGSAAGYGVEISGESSL